MKTIETNILIIDDSETVRREIISTLRGHALSTYCHEAEDGLEGLKILLEIKVDLVLCDVEMPRLDGFKFLSLVRAREELQDIPIILLTGKEDRESKIRGLEQGAADYITKPFDPGELVARVKIHLKIKRLQDELRQANEILLEVSNTDHLTGLYNRRYLMDALDREFTRSKRSGSFLSVLLLDVDNFKEINDRFGHYGGDLVLTETASILQQELRSYDTAVRYGGDEFFAMISDVSLQEAAAIADRVRMSIESSRFPGEMEDVRISFSIGVAVHPGTGVESVEDLIREADNALYRAKKNGRNRVEGPPQFVPKPA
jgi:two-component system, cell cycle response regulator